jgi:hypothetical protein
LLPPCFRNVLLTPTRSDKSFARLCTGAARIRERLHEDGAAVLVESHDVIRADAPRLNLDAAILMVDAALAAAGSTQGCTRDEVEAAFAHLADPAIKAATWLDNDRSAIVLLSRHPTERARRSVAIKISPTR